MDGMLRQLDLLGLSAPVFGSGKSTLSEPKDWLSDAVAERSLVSAAASPFPAALIEEVAAKAADYGRNAIAGSTKRAYANDWRDFESWCAERSLVALPAEPAIIGLYLTDCAQRFKVATLQRRLAAISRAHRTAGHRLDARHPAVADVLAGIRREKGTAPEKKAALVPLGLRAMLEALPEGVIGVRDRALLLVGFAGALRRSEIVALDAEDIEFDAQGLAVTIRRSKTDQEGEGYTIGIPFGENVATCPVRAVAAWMETAGMDGPEASGPLFRRVAKGGRIGGRLSGKAVALIVKRAAARAGMDPARFAGHSLRSGFATTAAANGADLLSIMAQTRHRSERVARGYVQRGSIFRNRAVAALGL